ncbi:MAG: DUF3810 family protein, partial [Clostridia bacterium]|nr:DUF3810 family protein [Clostridia bacterium]
EVMILYEDGSVRPYSHKETVRLCLDSYASLTDRWDFLSKLDAPVKELVSSPLMTYTHISGMYTFFTGEANLNTNYPYFVNVYTTAHEMAHQRGIARENEANFMAFLVCINSPDPYMKYAGYLNFYEYLISALGSEKSCGTRSPRSSMSGCATTSTVTASSSINTAKTPPRPCRTP